jgi:hypothetical protein
VGSSRMRSRRTVRQRLGQLDELLHAQRIGVDLAVAHLAQSYVEESLVGALQRLPDGRPASSAM